MPACPRCRSTDLVRVDLDPGDGLLRFAACRRCEHRWWTRPSEHGSVPLADVIEAVGASSA